MSLNNQRISSNRLPQLMVRIIELVSSNTIVGSISLPVAAVTHLNHNLLISISNYPPREISTEITNKHIESVGQQISGHMRVLQDCVGLDEIRIVCLNSEMEQLNRLIKDASNEFECHNFKTSLSLYVRCIEKCQQERLPSYILHNLKSSEAALRTILGEYETALKIVNQVLEENKQHWLCLLRRVQIFKKQNKYKKALKDVDTLFMYSPDNMQVAALKLEIKGLMAKPDNSSESEYENSEEEDEEEMLKFSALKKIDRTSCSIMIPNARQSRVTLSGDKSFFYEADENSSGGGARKSSIYTPHFIRQKVIEIDQELEQAETNESNPDEAPAPVIKSKPSLRTKSILRNRDSKIYVTDEKQQYSQQDVKKFTDKLKNIEGKLINSQSEEVIPRSSREVNFRKSVHVEDVSEIVNVIKKKPAGRKSCLKRCSFTSMSNEEDAVSKEKKPRGSRFESMSRSSIDGKVIRSDKKKKSYERQASKENIRENLSGSESEEGSQFNIYGSRKMEIPRQLRENLGLSSESFRSVEGEVIPKQRNKERTKSILKKNSILCTSGKKNKKVSIFFSGDGQEEQEKPERKPKKSVMFNTN